VSLFNPRIFTAIPAVAALLALALCPYFIDLGGSAIWDANEAFYVETPREMIERGDYVFPTFNYEPRVNKPVLSYWIVIAFYKLLWVSPGVQRIPIAIGGVVLIGVAFFLARAAAPPGIAVAASWWSALGLAVAPRLLMFSRRIFIDIYITMFMALTLLCFALSERYPARRRLFLILMYVSIGLGVLTKGPVAVLVPGLVFATYLVVHRELGRTRDMMLASGVLVVLAIVVPWYAALYQRAGWEPIVQFLVGENLDRYARGVGVNADHRGVLWYVPVVFSDSFPWSFLLVPAAVLWLRDRAARASAGADFRVRTLLWIWILAIVGFFSMSAGKQDLYIFPIVPAVAALAAVTIARVLAGEPIGRIGVRPALGAIGALLLIVGAGFFVLFHGPNAVYVLGGSAAIGIVAVGAGAATIMLAARGREAAALFVIAASLAVASWIFVLRVLPSFEAYKPAPALAGILSQQADPDDRIVTFNVALPSLVYYLRRHVDVYYDHKDVLPVLGSGRPTFLILTSDDYEKIIRPLTPVTLCQVASQPTFDVKLRNVLSRVRLPEVLLVTNKCGAR
jgi:4-amino-4-deoxy-L-arabinose transferase-like glycosyltransferase